MPPAGTWPSAEHLPQVVCDFALVSVALQMGGVALELRPSEHLADHIFKTLQTMAHISLIFPTPRSYMSFSIPPQPCALSVGLL